MPLSKIQRDILVLLAAHRDPKSYVAGATALNREGPRYSDDIDIFQDREERVAAAARGDADVLASNGFTIRWRRREPGFHAAVIERGAAEMRLEWARDSDFRFFPTVADELFGYVLHPMDIATNKALAAAGRREPRDIIDLLFVHDTIVPLGAVVWAAVGKDAGYSPEGLIVEIRRNARYRADDFADLMMTEPIDANRTAVALRTALDGAAEFVAAMPAGKEGSVYLQDNKVVQPDPTRLDLYREHLGRRGGHWPSSPEIGSDMLRASRPDASSGE